MSWQEVTQKKPSELITTVIMITAVSIVIMTVVYLVDGFDRQSGGFEHRGFPVLLALG